MCPDSFVNTCTCTGSCNDFPSLVVPTLPTQAEVSGYEANTSVRATFAKWQSHSAVIRASLQVTKEFAPWTSAPHVRLHGVPRKCKRIVDLIDVCYIDALTKNMAKPEDQRLTTADIVRGLFADCSQAVQRKPWGYCVKTIHTNTLLYSFEADCVLSSKMCLRLHGFPHHIDSDNSDCQLKALAGESWSLPCAATAFYAYALTCDAPWWAS